MRGGNYLWCGAGVLSRCGIVFKAFELQSFLFVITEALESMCKEVPHCKV